jgi:hypothetical protein
LKIGFEKVPVLHLSLGVESVLKRQGACSHEMLSTASTDGKGAEEAGRAD